MISRALAPSAAAAGVVSPLPLGVTGTAQGEVPPTDPAPTDVLLTPPSRGVPVDESLDERLARERAAAPRPAVAFDLTTDVSCLDSNVDVLKPHCNDVRCAPLSHKEEEVVPSLII